MLKYARRKSLAYIILGTLVKTLSYYVNRNKYGLLALSFGLYFIAPYIGLEKPFKFYELALWLDSLPHEYIISISTSIITIVGFLIAFQISTQSATNEMWMKVSQNTADRITEVSKFGFNSAQKFQSFSKLAIETYNDTDNKKDEEIKLQIKYLIDQVEGLQRRKEEVLEIPNALNLIKEQILYIVADSWFLDKSTNDLIGSFYRYGKTLLKFHFPPFQTSDPNIVQLYKQYLPIDDFIEIHKESEIALFNITLHTSDKCFIHRPASLLSRVV